MQIAAALVARSQDHSLDQRCLDALALGFLMFSV